MAKSTFSSESVFLQLIRMAQTWITLCLLVQGTYCFTVQNVQSNLCLQASLEDNNLRLGQCDLTSDLQQWFWREGRFLVNRGTKRCLSAHHADHVQTVACDSSYTLHWQCHNHRLTAQATFLDLASDENRLFLSNNKTQSAKWRSIERNNICKEILRSKRASSKPTGSGKAEALASPPSEKAEADAMAEAEAEREYLLWLYRTEDPSPWKYSMLALSFTALFLGVLLLVVGLMANRNRKVTAMYEAATKTGKTEELQRMTELKQPLSPASQESQLSQKHPQSSNGSEPPKSGDVVITWKDGTVSALYAEVPEEDV
ncbi:uncharacterized protein [Lepisosteus oculatus]|uniref:uncharacterized protein n=1 Tax=Lepisosteus oculatus TaxID=7918 RepID=UPI00073FD8CD|nr:PREDICTED: uncharacterized protein LOC107076909 [Lepisosteus oculatus]